MTKYKVEEGKLVKVKKEVQEALKLGKQITSIMRISKGYYYAVVEKDGTQAKFKALTDSSSPLNDLNGRKSTINQVAILADGDYLYFVTDDILKKAIIKLYEV